jgi:general secretion pathway protein J
MTARGRWIRAAGLAAEDGFSLIEALASVAVMAVILGALGLIAGQWIPSWSRGLAEAQLADQTSLAMERMAADISGALYVSPGGDSKSPMFDGSPSSVSFIRYAYGPGARDALEIVRISERRDGAGYAIVREQAPFVPSSPGVPPAPIALKDPVVLERGSLRLNFAYSGEGAASAPSWRGSEKLPRAMRITLRNAASNQIFAATAFALHVTAPPPKAKQQDDLDQSNQNGQPGGRMTNQ